MTPRRIAALLLVTGVLALLLAPAVSSLAGPAEGGGASQTAPKKGSKRAGRAKEPNPTPLWSLYPLRQGEGNEDPQAGTDALSTPPVKPTEQGAPEPGAEAGRTAGRQEGPGTISTGVLLGAVAVLTLVLLAIGIARRRARVSDRPAPGPIIPATPSSKSRNVARVTPSSVVAAVSTPEAPEPVVVAGSTTVSSNGSAEVERSRGRPRGPARPAAERAEAVPREPAAEASGARGPGEEKAGPAAPSGEAALPQPAAPEPSGEPDEQRPAPRPALSEPVEKVVEKAAPSAPEAVSRPREPEPPVESEPEPPVDREHVRVHLFDGRVIEGYKRGHYSKENRVLVLDVDHVLDADGREIPSTPLDSFLLPPQIDRIEALDGPSDPSQAGAPGRRHGGKLPAS